jgi:glycosyltransferase involved in cell wall biosynthesis
MGKLKGTVSVYSNSPGQPTGYGMQTELLVNYLRRDGVDVASFSNYGLEGNVSTYQTKYGVIPHYPRGLDPYSNDVLPMHHAHWKAQNKKQADLLITLYDVWVLTNKALDKLPIASWTPLDHMTMPPKVEAWLRKDNVTPIAMAPFGVEQMNFKGIECEYAPHSIDTKIMKPTPLINGQNVREYMGVTDDEFVVGSVAANKASGLVHRKAFSENLIAFSIFYKRHPNARLYLHTDPLGSVGGWNLLKLLQALEIPKEAVMFPPFVDYRYGMPAEALAALYTGMDVLLAPSYGGGFEIPIVEAQACGTRVIASNWTAPKDLVSQDGWLIDGQPSWDAGQDAFWQIPSIPAIVDALELAYEAERGDSQESIKFASQFDTDLVWDKYWTPILNKLLK